jgi:hypothetical protein
MSRESTEEPMHEVFATPTISINGAKKFSISKGNRPNRIPRTIGLWPGLEEAPGPPAGYATEAGHHVTAQHAESGG